jgi:hypothetical protein
MTASIMSEYWLREAAGLQSEVELLRTEIERLQKYESMVHFIANDYVELSYEKAQWQRDDWMKRCKNTIGSEYKDVE